MSVIHVDKTGHVLCAFTRTSDPESEPDVETVVGSALPLRDPETGDELLSLSVDLLKATNVDLNDSVLLVPRNYVLVDKVPQEGTTLTNAPTYDPATKELKVALNGPVTESVTVTVYVEGGAAQGLPPLSVDIVAPASDGVATVTLAAGDYHVLALAPGYRASLTELTVP
jgi:hypothetical protein